MSMTASKISKFIPAPPDLRQLDKSLKMHSLAYGGSIRIAALIIVGIPALIEVGVAAPIEIPEEFWVVVAKLLAIFIFLGF